MTSDTWDKLLIVTDAECICWDISSFKKVPLPALMDGWGSLLLVSLCDCVWLCVAVCSCVWLCVAVFGSVWLCVSLGGSV